MKNFLKVKPEVYEKEREIGQTSFIIKRAMINSLFLTFVILFVNLLIRFFFFNDVKVLGTVVTGILMGIGISIGEWASLEYNYRKNERKKELEIKNQSGKARKILKI